MNALGEISKIVEHHRAEAVICCPEDCWCWDIEAVIFKHEEANEIIPIECYGQTFGGRLYLFRKLFAASLATLIFGSVQLNFAVRHKPEEE